ncbi:MAG: hypothetical protein QF492_02500, partial [Candidatus Krumholzibacteria bacterium]|nr:hypothetical protein [Candidatus Krumholzibacteria bacterium]
MEKTATLLEILESNLPVVQERMALGIRSAGQANFQDKSDEDLDKLAWSYLDPILQSLRFDNDY